MNNKNSFFLYGYHAQGNFGDDIFLKLIFENVILKNGTELVFCKSGKMRSILDERKVTKVFSPRRLKRFVWISIFLKAIKVNKFVFCAGSLFVSQAFFLMFLCLSTLKIIRGKKFKIYAVGVTLGPIKGVVSKFLLRRSLELFDFVGVRDEESLKFYNKDNVVFCNDIALSYIKEFKEKKILTNVNRSFCIGISVNREIYESKGWGILVEKITEYLSINKKCEVKIFNTCIDPGDGDREVSNLFMKLIQDRVENKIFIVDHDPMNVDYFIGEIIECRKLFSARLHVGLVGVLRGLQVLQFQYAPKIKRIYDSMGVSNACSVAIHDFEKKLCDFLFCDSYSPYVLQEGIAKQMLICEKLYQRILE